MVSVVVMTDIVSMVKMSLNTVVDRARGTGPKTGVHTVERGSLLSHFHMNNNSCDSHLSLSPSFLVLRIEDCVYLPRLFVRLQMIL